MQQTLNNFLTPGKRSIDFGGWEGCMQEPANIAVRFGFSKKFGNQHQMVVMNPDIVVIFVHGQDRLRKYFVGFLVCTPLPCAALVHALVEGRHDVVKQWPQDVVGEAVVVPRRGTHTTTRSSSREVRIRVPFFCSLF